MVCFNLINFTNKLSTLAQGTKKRGRPNLRSQTPAKKAKTAAEPTTNHPPAEAEKENIEDEPETRAWHPQFHNIWVDPDQQSILNIKFVIFDESDAILAPPPSTEFVLVVCSSNTLFTVCKQFIVTFNLF